jgi:hypothetical protein
VVVLLEALARGPARAITSSKARASVLIILEPRDAPPKRQGELVAAFLLSLGYVGIYFETFDYFEGLQGAMRDAVCALCALLWRQLIHAVFLESLYKINARTADARLLINAYFGAAFARSQSCLWSLKKVCVVLGEFLQCFAK